KAALLAVSVDLLRLRESGEGGNHLRIVDPEQRARARRFQYHFLATPPYVGKPRQRERIRIADLRDLRPVIRNLRLDHDVVASAARGSEAIFQKAAPRQSPGQEIDLLVGRAAAAGRGQRQSAAKFAEALLDRKREISEALRIFADAGEEGSVGLCLKRDLGIQARSKNRRCRLARARFLGRGQAELLPLG